MGIDRNMRQALHDGDAADEAGDHGFADPSEGEADHGDAELNAVHDLVEILVEALDDAGTDAAFAALKSAAPVIESFGVRGFGAHSNDAEYIDIDSIEPRLYLLTRMVMDVARGKTQ